MSFNKLLKKFQQPIVADNVVTVSKYSQSMSIIENIRRSKSIYFNDTDNEDISNQIVLGILFIIIDEFPNEAIWRLWLQKNSNVVIFFHAKYPERVKSHWVRAHLVKSFHILATWGSLELTKVMINLLNESFHESSSIINRFCFASESCIPIWKSADECISIIQAKDRDNSTTTSQRICSWVNYHNKPSNGYTALGQFDPLKRVFPLDCIFKSDQWVLLTRSHVEQILKLSYVFSNLESQTILLNSNVTSAVSINNASTQSETLTVSAVDSTDNRVRPINLSLLRLFKSVRVSDEMYIPISLAILGYISNSDIGAHDLQISDHDSKKNITESTSMANIVLRCRVTYCDWENNARSPTTFSDYDDLKFCSHFKAARAENCLFFRKFKLKDAFSSSQQYELIKKWVMLTHSDSKSEIIDDKMIEAVVCEGKGIVDECILNYTNESNQNRNYKRPRLHDAHSH